MAVKGGPQPGKIAQKEVENRAKPKSKHIKCVEYTMGQVQMIIGGNTTKMG
jgi:hypothetical protein